MAAFSFLESVSLVYILPVSSSLNINYFLFDLFTDTCPIFDGIIEVSSRFVYGMHMLGTNY